MATLTFKGKALVQNHHLMVPFHELVPVKTKGLNKNPSLNGDSLIIEGDNLLALKALLPVYQGRIKCIYIDPPYNTGNEHWAYNDKVNSPMMREWLGKAVDRDDLTRHDKWCCMMLPRLKLLRELLKGDGAIFVSIDDNEAHHLRCLMDEVFGEENFLATIAWQKKYTRSNNAKLFSSQKDLIICYRRSEALTLLREPYPENKQESYGNPDKDPRGEWTSSSYVNPASHEARPNLVYEIKRPADGKIIKHSTRAWKYSRATHEQHVLDDRLWWGADGLAAYPRLKVFRNPGGVVPVDFWDFEYAGTTSLGAKEIKEIFNKNVFETCKPTQLVKRILQIASDKDSIILDSFAGSGSTAHAVLAQNAEDGGNRRFILVECESYVHQTTAERVRRIIKGKPKAKGKESKKGLKGSFGYFKLGQPLELKTILNSEELPNYRTLAAYVFFTATGESFDPVMVRKREWFIGASQHYDVFLIYESQRDKLKKLALTLDLARRLSARSQKQKLVFAPAKYLDAPFLSAMRITFCQLPYQIYHMAGGSK